MYLSRSRAQVFAFQDSQQTLMNADILLLSLHHPNPFFSHGKHYAKDVDIVTNKDLLENTVKAYECPWATNASTINWEKYINCHYEYVLVNRNSKFEETIYLQWTTIGLWSGGTLSLNALTNLTNVWGGFGTPKSGQVVKWKCLTTLWVSP